MSAFIWTLHLKPVNHRGHGVSRGKPSASSFLTPTAVLSSLPPSLEHSLPTCLRGGSCALAAALCLHLPGTPRRRVRQTFFRCCRRRSTGELPRLQIRHLRCVQFRGHDPAPCCQSSR